MILTDATNTTAVYLDDLVANPDNPRQNLGDITELAESIRDIGLLTPLLVVRNSLLAAAALPSYMVIDGHRRLAALRALDATMTPDGGYTDTIPVRVVSMNRTERLLAALATQGKPLDPLDEARAFQALIDLDLTQRQIAERVGCNQSHVSRRLALLELDAPTAAAVADGKVKLRDAEAKARGKTPVPKAPITAHVSIAERNELRNAIGRLEADNTALREIAAKAREAVVEVKAALAEQPPVEVAGVLGETTPFGYMVVIREHGAWGTTWDGEIYEDLDTANENLIEARSDNNGKTFEAAIVEVRFIGEQVAATADDAMFPEHPVSDALEAAGELKVDWPAPPAEVPPEWLTKQPWGTYTMSAEARLLGMIAKLTKPDSVRHVIAFEAAHDNRPDILDAARARLVELGPAVAA